MQAMTRAMATELGEDNIRSPACRRA
ncbi:MAG TPA: hypothetical protein VI854_08400 [Acidimicrobiia bacterium]|nr:hypothetical protein [Acidimicrobiia bacterium]